MSLTIFGCGREESKQQEETHDSSVVAEVVSDGKFTLNYTPNASLNPYTTTSELNRIADQLAYAGNPLTLCNLPGMKFL